MSVLFDLKISLTGELLYQYWCCYIWEYRVDILSLRG